MRDTWSQRVRCTRRPLLLNSMTCPSHRNHGDPQCLVNIWLKHCIFSQHWYSAHQGDEQVWRFTLAYYLRCWIFLSEIRKSSLISKNSAPKGFWTRLERSILFLQTLMARVMSRLDSEDGMLFEDIAGRLWRPNANSICVGFNFANQVMFIQIAMLLWAFNFDKPLDVNGNPITPDRDACIDAGVVVCVFSPP